MKKILIIHESFNGGGAEKVLCDILQHFDYERYQVTLFLKSKVGPFLQSIPWQVRTTSFRNSRKSFTDRIINRISKRWYDHILRHRFRTELCGEHYDCIISFMEGVSAKLHSFVLDKASHHVTWIHTDICRNFWYKATFRKGRDHVFYMKVDDVVFVSEGTRIGFENIYATAARKHVVYNLIDREEIIKRGLSEPVRKSRFTICNVGRLEKQKQQHRIVSIASIFKQKNIEADFWIVGSGSLEQELKAQAVDLGVTDMIKFWGFQSNPYRFVKASDVFLLTSNAEGFSLVVCESLCLGIPVVSTKVTGPTELLKNGVGILCDENVEQLAQAIISLYSRPDLLEHYSEMSTQRSLDFNIQTTMEQIYKVINEGNE